MPVTVKPSFAEGAAGSSLRWRLDGVPGLRSEEFLGFEVVLDSGAADHVVDHAHTLVVRSTRAQGATAPALSPPMGNAFLTEGG